VRRQSRARNSGYRFRTSTDTEVILALYERVGLDRMLERLDGMFAIVIADTRRGAVHLIRDRVGIKPLYWVQCGATLLFASEAKAFLAHPAFRQRSIRCRSMNCSRIATLQAKPRCSKACGHVAPGHRLTHHGGRGHEVRYWSILDRPRNCASHATTRSTASIVCCAAAWSRSCAATSAGVPAFRWRRLVARHIAGAFSMRDGYERLFDRGERATIL
jgi:asparagine synthase (glutamine-hydrolysing)